MTHLHDRRVQQCPKPIKVMLSHFAKKLAKPAERTVLGEFIAKFKTNFDEFSATQADESPEVKIVANLLQRSTDVNEIFTKLKLLTGTNSMCTGFRMALDTLKKVSERDANSLIALASDKLRLGATAKTSHAIFS